MIDHISFAVNNFDESVRFYDTTLACLGLERLMTFESHEHRVAGYGKDNKPFFWLGDTGWELFHRLSREEADKYLKNRADKGFTVIQAVALAELDGLHTP